MTLSTSSFCLDSERAESTSDTANNSDIRSHTAISIDSFVVDDSPLLGPNSDTPTTSEINITNNIQRVNEMTGGLIDFLQRTFRLPVDSDFGTIRASIKKCVKLMVERKKELKSLRRENREMAAIIASQNAGVSDTSKDVGFVDGVHKDRIRELERLLDSALKANESLNLELNNKADVIKNLQKNQTILETKLSNTIAKTDSKAESTDAQIYIISQELQNEQVRSKQYEEKLAERKDKNRALKRKLAQLTTEIKERDSKYEELKISYDKLFLERDDLIANSKSSFATQQLEAELKGKKSEIETLHIALSELTNQLDEITEDMHAENSSRNRVIALIQRQTMAMTQCEHIANSKTTENNQLLSQVQVLTRENKELTDKVNSSANIVDTLPSILSEFVYEKIKDEETLSDTLYEIINDKTTLIQHRVTMFLNTMLDHYQSAACSSLKSKPMLKDISDLQQQNSRLLMYIHNLSHFVDRIASSGDVQDWLIDSNNHEVRNRLSSQSVKIQSFMQSNNLLVDQTPLAEAFIYFPEFCQRYLDEKSFEHDEFAKEAFVLLEQYLLANSILTKYSTELQKRGQLLMSDVKQMKQEVAYLQREAENTNLEATVKMEAQLEVEKEAKNQMQSTIDKIHQVLLASIDKDNDNSTALYRCLGIINGNENSVLDDDSSIDISLLNEHQFQTPQEYIKVLENKCVALNDKVKLTEDALQQEMIDKERYIRDLGEQLVSNKNDYEDTLNIKTVEIDRLTSEVESLKQVLKSTREENQKLSNDYNDSQNAVLKLSTEAFDLEQKLKKEFEAIIKENDDQMKLERDELNSQIAEKQAKIEELCNFHESEICRMKNSHKSKVEQLNKELKVQTDRGNKIRDHFETMLEELRSKLQESRLSESSALSDAENLAIENNDLKSRLSSLNIDIKVLRMKLHSAEEKAKRDRGFDNTKAHMKILSLETERQTAIEQIKSQCNEKMYSFLTSICSKFKDYVDFNKAISEESVSEFLDNVYNTMNKIVEDNNKLVRLNSELDEVRKTLDIDAGESVAEAVETLNQKVQHYDKLKDQIEKDSNEASSLVKQTRLAFNASHELKAWEDWARRIHSLITENFAVTKSDGQLRYLLEEALMSTVGKRSHWRRLEILRMEKVLLVTGLARIGGKRNLNNITLAVLFRLYDSIHRMQKLSGHLRCSICINSKFDNRSYNSTSLEQKKLPLLPII